MRPAPRPNALPNPPADVPHWIKPSDAGLKTLTQPVAAGQQGRHLCELPQVPQDHPRVRAIQSLGSRGVERLLSGQCYQGLETSD